MPNVTTETLENHYCNSPLWSNQSIWQSDDPNFTECFQKTVLVWIPAVTFCILSIFDIYLTNQSKMANIRWNNLNLAKVFFLSDLIVINLIEFGVLYTDMDNFTMSQLSAPVIRASIYTASLIITYFHKVRGICSSGFQFIFWLITVICGSVQFRHEIRELISTSPNCLTTSVCYVIQYGLILTIFLLNFCADKEPTYFKYGRSKHQCPEMFSSFPSRLLYIWYDRLIWKGYKNPLKTDDLWTLRHEHSAQYISKIFHYYWHKKITGLRNKYTALLLILIKMNWTRLIFGSFLKLIHVLLGFVTPLVLGYIVEFTENKRNEPIWKGYFYAILIFASLWLQSLIVNYYYLLRHTDGMRIQTSLISAIYNKSLYISNYARRTSTIGEIINLMSVDAQRLLDLSKLDLIWACPLQIIITVYLIWRILGPAVIIGLTVLFVLIPLNIFMTNKYEMLQSKQMKHKDTRIKLMYELLNYMKVLKLYAWELSFEQKVLNIRKIEMHTLKIGWYFISSMLVIWSCLPFFLSLATFASYVLLDKNNILDYEKAFVTLTLLDSLRLPLLILPTAVAEVVQMNIALRRISAFMDSDELKSENANQMSIAPKQNSAFLEDDELKSESRSQMNIALKRISAFVNTDELKSENSNKVDDGDILTMENASFTWDGRDAALKNINLTFKRGSLNAVVGTVGSGKSSLLSAFLGEMEKISGTLKINGTISYVSQQAWIQNATLRDNILFGKLFDQSYYEKVIEACALRSDIELFPGGDLVEIGANAINLSGGQKQRVNLARAVYNNSDIYFFDDPLSAVDINVGRHIFQKVIGPSGLLKNKTRILVTHNMDCLPFVENVVILMDGQVKDVGPYFDLLGRNSFSEFLTEHLSDNSRNEKHMGKQENSTAGLSENEMIPEDILEFQESLVKGKITEIEKSETGAVKWQVCMYFLSSMGIWLFLVVLIANLFFQGFRITNYFWLSIWAGDEDRSYENLLRNIGIYSAVGLGQSISSAFIDIGPLLGCWYATRAIHIKMLKAITRAPLSFFISVPTGRIISRFSQDIDILDTKLPRWFSDSVYCVFSVMGIFIVIGYSIPSLLILVVPFVLSFYYLREFFIRVSRQLKRLESISKTPIYSHFNETLTGVAIIRAYNEQKRFTERIEQLIDLYNNCYYPLLIAKRWLTVRLELVCNLVIFCTMIFFVANSNFMEAGIVGVCLSYTLNLSNSLNALVENSSQLETNLVSVERLKEYCEIQQEPEWENPKINAWPDKGRIEFKNYSVRYRSDLNLVLNNLNITIYGGEKVGIIGRTGAGKSSIALALFRILEAAQGSIVIDNIDISTLNLQFLRTQLTIIPQDPILFTGTIRFNLDPFSKYPDFEIWEALELVHLKYFIENLSQKLDYEVLEGGENFSVGQKQLICLARAVLRKTKILILDEATAAVDLETDHLIQMTIRTAFAHCTVLTIAHRLNTIMDSDRLLVIDKGVLIENGNPKVLLADEQSAFYKMAKEVNLI